MSWLLFSNSFIEESAVGLLDVPGERERSICRLWFPPNLYHLASVSHLGNLDDVWLRICHLNMDNSVETRTFTPQIRSCLLTGGPGVGEPSVNSASTLFQKQCSSSVNSCGSRITCTATVEKTIPRTSS